MKENVSVSHSKSLRSFRQPTENNLFEIFNTRSTISVPLKENVQI